MKKLIISFIFILGLQTQAQEIGIRLGSFVNSNVAIDGVLNFDDNTRLHGDINFGNGIGANLLYDFKVAPLSNDFPNFDYYFGAGLSTFIGDPFILGVNGEAGIEYVFKDTPITLGLDWRPQLNIVAKTSLEFFSFGFNVRYRFNEI